MPRAFGLGSTPHGQFWYGNNHFPGFLYKKNLGVGVRRSTLFTAGGVNSNNQSIYNTFVPGSGIGGVSVANRRANFRRATSCKTIIV
jgi:hypothetical protein